MRIFKSHPLLKLVNSYLIDSSQPSNLSFLWNFGSLLAFCLIIQIVTGVTLAMHYNSNVLEAFDSVEHIMRDVNNGWLIRYLHSNTASAFFFTVYFHIGRGLYYGSYKAPRTLVWTIGTVIFILMMATAFLGYVLPYGQMSLWGATVITSLMSAIPWVGQDIVEFIWGGFSVNNATLNRFFALHFVLPFILAALVLMHMIVLHEKAGSGNPLGITANYDRLAFAPYFVFKDLITIFLFILVLSIFVFFMPNKLGDSENYVMANAMQTPSAIVPEWYLLPFYAILRSIPNKLLGVIAMFSAILILLIMPFTDLSRSRGIQFKPLSKVAYFLFIANFLILMELGAKHVESPFIEFGQISTVVYFAYFLIIVPLISLVENTLTELYMESDESLESDDIRRPYWFNLNGVKSNLNWVKSSLNWVKSTPPVAIVLASITIARSDPTTPPSGLYTGNNTANEFFGDLPTRLQDIIIIIQHPNGWRQFVQIFSGMTSRRPPFTNQLLGANLVPEYRQNLQGIINSNPDSLILQCRGNIFEENSLFQERVVYNGFDEIRNAGSAAFHPANNGYDEIRNAGSAAFHPSRSDTPRPWGTYFQDSASPQMEGLVELHNNILFYLVIILFGVGWLLLIIVKKFTNTESPISYKYSSHGTLIELIWTISPALVLILIAFPSFKLLYLMDEVIDPAMAILAEGHQWYWSYQYPDFLNSDDEFIEFDSYLIPESDLEDGTLRMLEVDNRLILPEHTHIRIIVTGADVIHSLACPALGLKCDAYPGRLNQTSVIISREGTFYGQCSEICGILHSSMPIVIESVSIEKFVSWLREQ